MKKLLIILGFITSVSAVILAVTPLSKIAYIPSIAALVFGVLALYASKGKQQSKKWIQLIFLLTISALVLTTYKTIFNTTEVGNTEQLEQKVEQLEEESIQELNDIEIDDTDL